MTEPENHALALLREMRAEMKAGFEGIDKRFEALERRIDGMNANGAKALKSFIGRRSMTERSFASVELQFASIEDRLLALGAR